MTKTLLAVVLIAAGGLLLYFGNKRKESLAGAAQTVGHDIATAVDGKSRVTDHTLYFVGGGALILAGIVVGLRRS